MYAYTLLVCYLSQVYLGISKLDYRRYATLFLAIYSSAAYMVHQYLLLT